MQRRNLVVEGVTALVETAQALRQRVVKEGRVDMHTLRGQRRGARLFEQVDQAARIAVSLRDQAQFGILGESQIRQRLAASALEKLRHLVIRQRLEHVHRGAREQGGIDFEGRIFGRRTDKGQQPTFNVRQKGILLRLVEAMDFVDEENRLPAVLRTRHLGARDCLADVFDAGENGREGHEFGVESVGHQARQGRLADAGRPPEDQRM